MERLTKRDIDGFPILAKNIDYTTLLDRLAAYEDAEEQGLLVRLPCKVGDKVYLTIGSKKKIHEAIAGMFYIDQMGLEVEAIYNHFGLMCFCGRLVVNVFATREEAEAAPKEG